MEKIVYYKGTYYTIEILFSNSNYFLRCIELGTKFKLLPMDCLNDIEKIKPYIIDVIKNNYDLKVIDLWDGKL